MAAKKFSVQIITENGVAYFGNCSVLFVPTEHDTLAIMAYHEPMLVRLSEGPITLREDTHTKHIIDIKHGVLYVGENEASVIAT